MSPFGWQERRLVLKCLYVDSLLHRIAVAHNAQHESVGHAAPRLRSSAKGYVVGVPYVDGIGVDHSAHHLAVESEILLGLDIGESLAIFKRGVGVDHLVVGHDGTTIAQSAAIVDVGILAQCVGFRLDNLALGRQILKLDLVAADRHHYTSGAWLALVHRAIGYGYASSLLQFLGIVLCLGCGEKAQSDNKSK